MTITIRRRQHSQPLVEDSAKNSVDCPEKLASSKSLPLRFLKTLFAGTVLINTAIKMDKLINKIDINMTKDEILNLSIPFPPPASEWLGDIDTNTNSSVICGAFKCAFPSRTNQKRLDFKKYGYLVSQSHTKPKIRFKHLLLATQKAQELANKFSIQQWHLALPQKMNFTESLKEKLNKNVVKNGESVSDRFKGMDGNRNQLIIQPIEFVPEGSILFGCNHTKKGKQRFNKMEQFLANQTALSATKLLEFKKKLQFDLKETLMMLNSTEGSCLRKDFQVFINPFAGRIYHIDIDRCFVGPEPKSKVWCPKDLQIKVC